MSTTTTNLALVKPATTDLIAISVINGNMDTLDSAVAGKAAASTTVNGHALTSNVTVTAGDLGVVPTGTTVNGHALSSNVTVSATDVGLGNCDNTSDANKPVSTATTNALALKVPFTEVINTVASAGTAQTLAEPATKSINDLTLDNASPCVLTFPTATAGTSFTLILRQSGSTRLVTWPGGIKWAGGAAPTLSTATGSIDFFSFIYVTAWNGFVAGLAMA